MLDNSVVSIVDNHLASSKTSEWDLDGLQSKFLEVYDQNLPEEIKECKNVEQVYDLMYDTLKKRYDEKVEELGSEQFSKIEKYIMLEVLDQKWRQNLKDLTELREGINLQSYGQKIQ